MRFLAFLFSLSLCLHATPRLIHGSDPMQVSVYQLDNGLTIYLSQNNQAPHFYAEIAVRTGGRNDPSDCTGLAHYLEHLLFKGTRRMGTLDYAREKPHLNKITALYEKHFREKDPTRRTAIYKQINAEAQAAAKYAVANDIDRIYKFIGGRAVNAHTSMDETTYKVALPANQLERWAMIESERFSNPVFRLFHTELETVYEEKNTSLDSGQDQLWEEVQRVLYPDHPYGSQTVLGKAAHLKSPSIKRIREYFEKYYVPSNMAVFISGDFATAEALAVIDKYFGRWPAKPSPYEPHHFAVRKTPAPLESHCVVAVAHEGEESITLAWPTVDRNHQDYPALVIMDMVLNNSVAGLIDLNLVKTQKVRAAGSFTHFLKEAGAQYLWATPRDGQELRHLEKLLLEQTERLKNGRFEPWIIPAIVKDLEKSLQENYESNVERVSIMRDAFISGRRWQYASQEMTYLKAVTKADVVRVANKYLTRRYVTGHLINGKPDIRHIDKPRIDPIPLNDSARSAFAKSVLEIETKPLEPKFLEEGRDYQKSAGKNGVHYYTTYNPSNSLYTLTWTFPVGSLHNPDLDLAFDLLEKSGTARQSPEDLAKRWYQLAASYTFSVHPTRTEITLSGIASTFPEAVGLFWEWLHGYKPDKAALAKIIDSYQIQRADDMKDPATMIHALARYARYGKQSTYLARTSSADMRKLSPADLQKMLAHLLTHPHSVSYVGRLSGPQWRKLVPVLEVSSQPPAIPDRQVRKADRPAEIRFIHREMAQAQIWIESASPALTPRDRPMLHMFNNYFNGGMSSIVFQELREARGLAYSASGYVTRPRWKGDHSLVVGRIASQADKADAALAKFIGLFDKLPASETRFRESRDAMLAAYRAQRTPFRSAVPTILLLERQGLDFNPEKLTYETLPGMTLKKLLAFHGTHVGNKPKRISIVGDRTRINMDALEKFAPVTELTVKDVFTP